MSISKHPTAAAILFTMLLTLGGALPATAAQYCQTQTAAATGSASGAIAGQTPTKAIPWVQAAYEGAGKRLPANFFAGMMYYESSFNPTIRNSLGYMGLCQIGTEEWRHLTGGTPSAPNIYEPLTHAKYCGKLSAQNLDKVLKARATNLPANLKSLPDWQLVVLAHNAGPAYLTPQKKGRIPAETRRSIGRMMPYMNATTTNNSLTLPGGTGAGLKAGAVGNPRALKAAIQKTIKPAWDGKFDAPAPGTLHVTSPYGPHIHYEIYQNGKPIDPAPYMQGATATPTSEADTTTGNSATGFCSYLPGGSPTGEEGPLNPSGNKIVEAAIRERGKPYVWGAEGPSSYDCSGLVKWAYAKGARINLPHQSEAQKNSGIELPVSEAQPGDVLWKPGHVGIYIGDGKYVHAPKPGDVVKTADMKTSKWQKAIRITKGK